MQARANRNRVHVSKRGAEARQRIRGTRRQIATRLAQTICPRTREPAAKNRKTADDFKEGRFPKRPGGGWKAVAPCHSGSRSLRDGRTPNDSDVVALTRTIDAAMETRLVHCRSWNRERNSCSGGQPFRRESCSVDRHGSDRDFNRKSKRSIKQDRQC